MRERRGGVESLTGWREQKRHNQKGEAMIENEEGEMAVALREEEVGEAKDGGSSKLGGISRESLCTSVR